MARALAEDWLRLAQADLEEVPRTDGTVSADSQIPAGEDAEQAHMPSMRRHTRRTPLLALSACLALALAAAALRSMMRSDARPLEKQVSMEEFWDKVGDGQGCSNWKAIALGEARLVDPAVVASCGELCAETAGCSGFGFEPDECHGEEQRGKGYCFLWSGSCDMETNECWDEYQMRHYTPVPWTLVSTRMGCSNYKSIRMHEGKAWNANACGEQCQQTSGCQSFNFQPLPCDGEHTRAAGACDLFNADCDWEESSCWDLYKMLPVPDPTAAPNSPASPTPSPTPLRPAFTLVEAASPGDQHLVLQPLNEEPARPGNILMVGDQESATYESVEVAPVNESSGFLRVDVRRPLKAGYAAGTKATLLEEAATAEVVAPADQGSLTLAVNHIAFWEDGDAVSVKDNGLGTFGEMTNAVAEVKSDIGALQLALPLAFAVPKGARVAKVVSYPLTGTVTAEALAGSSAVTVSDAADWKVRDMVHFLPPSEGCRRLSIGDDMYNYIAAIDYPSNRLEFDVPLAETVPAHSRLEKVTHKFPLKYTVTNTSTSTTITTVTATNTSTTITTVTATSTTIFTVTATTQSTATITATTQSTATLTTSTTISTPPKISGFSSMGADTACLLDASDATEDGNGSVSLLVGPSHSQCVSFCEEDLSCTGVEYHSADRMCEHWRQPITSTKPLAGYECIVKRAATSPSA